MKQAAPEKRVLLVVHAIVIIFQPLVDSLRVFATLRFQLSMAVAAAAGTRGQIRVTMTSAATCHDRAMGAFRHWLLRQLTKNHKQHTRKEGNAEEACRDSDGFYDVPYEFETRTDGEEVDSTKRVFTGQEGIAGQWGRKERSLNHFTLVDDVLSEILSYADTRTLLQVALVSCSTQNVACDALYRKICVSAFRAGQLCQTLAALKQCAERVITLRIRHKDAGILHGIAFEAAFANMKHLQTLHLEVPVDTHALLRSFTGSLTTFTSSQPVSDSIYKLLLRQTTITILGLEEGLEKFHRIDVSPGLLPNLIRVRAPPRDVESLVPGRPVRHVRFHYTPQDAKLRPTVQLGFFLGCTVPLLRLDLMACQLINQPDLETLFSELRHLTVFQDDTWGKRRGSRNLEDELWFMADATCDLPKLCTLVVVTTLARKKALMIYDAVKTYSTAPRFRVLAIHTRDRCIGYTAQN
ncbi:hypothetical protein C8R44DRAFT_736149 [Mycena epipterygia]|nr:hypothetical protein C8R44DRAFT_736149 [Mycena epipterygia]